MSEDRYFTCAICKGEFMSSWTEQEAIEEYAASGMDDGTDRLSCCDDCYAKIQEWRQTRW